jgi:hypothetical protein
VRGNSDLSLRSGVINVDLQPKAAGDSLAEVDWRVKRNSVTQLPDPSTPAARCAPFETVAALAALGSHIKRAAARGFHLR